MIRKCAYYKCCLLLLIVLGCMACDGLQINSKELQAIPFKASKESKWGMITPEGEVLFEDEFLYPLTCLKDDRFLTQNDEGLFDIYKIQDGKPCKVSGGYAEMTEFRDGIAFAAYYNEPIVLIDKDGQVLKTIAELDGKRVCSVRYYAHGLVAYVTEDSNVGVCNTAGEVILPSDYDEVVILPDGHVLAYFNIEDGDNYRVWLFNAKGKKLVDMKNYLPYSYAFRNYDNTSSVLAKLKLTANHAVYDIDWYETERVWTAQNSVE